IPKPSNRNLIGGGFLSGIFGTATSIGGPPIMIVMRSFGIGSIRATLSAILFIGGSVSLLALFFTRSLDLSHVMLAVNLIPFLVVGIAISNILIIVLSKRVIYYFGVYSSLFAAFAMVFSA